MVHPLQQRIHAIGQRAKQLILVYGFGWFLACVITSVVILGFFDFLFRFEDSILRIAVTAALLSTTVWSFRRFVLPAIRYGRNDVAIAQRVEKVHPQLGDRLSSAIEFLGQQEADATSGSLQLRHSVIAETSAIADSLELERCLDSTRPFRAAIVSGLVAVVAIVICALNLSATTIAAQRLVWPLGSTQWPRVNYLKFKVAPARLAAGDNFEVVVVDESDHLPATVEFQIWRDGADRGAEIRSEPMQRLQGTMVYRIENVTQAFRYRAVGGDDQGMDWLSLEIVDPVQVDELQLTLHSPAYTGRENAAVEQQIRALIGSRISVQGRATRTVSAAAVVMHTEETEVRIPLQVADDGLDFILPADGQPAWEVTDSGLYWIELTDEEGLAAQATSSWELTAIPDRPPSISISLPNLQSSQATSKAVFPLQLQIRDDLAINSLTLKYSITAATRIVVDNEEAAALGEDASIEVETVEISLLEEQAVAVDGDVTVPIDFPWELGQIGGLKTGDVIHFQIVAIDNKPQSAESEPLRITIIDDTKLEQSLLQQQTRILAQIAEALQLQRNTRGHVEALRIQLAETGVLRDIDLAQMQSAELAQRQIQRLLAEPGSGVAARIELILRLLQQNQLDNAEFHDRMVMILATVRSLEHNQLPVIQRELLDALKTSRAKLVNENGGTKSARKAVDSQFHLTLSTQDVVIQQLEELLGQLNQWDNYQRVARDIASVRDEQAELNTTTENLRLKLLQTTKELTPEETAQLKRVANRQKELARRFERIQSRMQQMKDKLQEEDPLAAKSLAGALDKARSLAISGQMRESARHLNDEQVGQASQRQKEIDESLAELLDALSNRREQQLERKIEELKDSATRLETLRKQQQDVTQQLKEAAKQEDLKRRQQELQRLTKQQQKLAEQTQKLAERLQKLQAPGASEKAQQAAGQQQAAAKSAGQGQDPQQAQDAAQQAEKAEQLLEEAQQQLQKQIEQAEQDLFFEQLAKLEQAVEGFVVRQKNVRDQAVQLNQIQLEQGKWRREQIPTLRNLAAEERLLGEECGALAEKVAKAEAFTLGLRGAMREMIRAGGRLEQLDVSQQTVDITEVALSRLLQLQDALKPPENNNENNDDNENGGGEGNQQQQQPQGDEIQSLAELKLLKLMQEEIHRRTLQLEQRRVDNGNLTEDGEQELVDLALEQGKLADIVLNLIKTLEADPEENPESLPELENDLEESLLDAVE